MSVLVYTESLDGKFKKASFEAVSYAKKVADLLGAQVVAVAINVQDVSELSKYGAHKTLKIMDDHLKSFNVKAYTKLLSTIFEEEKSSVLVFPGTTDANYMAPMISYHIQASYVSNVAGYPESAENFVVKRTSFTNKAYSFTKLVRSHKALTISKNSVGISENPVDGSVVDYNANLSEADFGLKVTEVQQSKGQVTIADAEVVVSGGRGLKGPENWNILEDFAEVLGAATACSKPVSDLGWRPHSEHVGQTGKPVATNLYFAIGISGAIQHIAGINSSKVKVVINTDPEAPFFKVADYGVVGDAFDIVPRLTQKIKAFKLQNS